MKDDEQSCQQKESHYRLIFDASQDGMIIIDGANDSIVEANPFFLHLIGRSLNEIKSKPFSQAGFMTDEKEALKFFCALPDKKTIHTRTIELLHKKGHRVSVECVSHSISIEDKSLIICNIRDITRRVKAEAEVEASRKIETENLYGVINALSNAVEIHDPYTTGHQYRVCDLSVAIAKEMDLPETTINAVRIAALLHDIGKLAVPSELLNKPSSLSPIEFALVETHSAAGAEILKPINFPWNIPLFVHQHHERLDGSGYPDGLKGAAISLEARIIGVADTMEAMCSHRPYRPAQTRKEALHEISIHSGIKYDEQVVAACVRLFLEKSFKFPDTTALLN
ncbi:HD-GYP domain-containing protein [Chlorobium phaeovibrioides]|uniref:HD domain-containing protein n=1 Tax=Chlorobium phaeovibrioides TaxID=1094 RepID=A0ABW9UT71_CHLPH|nr:HD-GYP domain-containing protein [Chlorobium phaeovibrioides]MWV55132.1 HD domain-containing protein [Chlorobium phaeovibrioides]